MSDARLPLMLDWVGRRWLWLIAAVTMWRLAFLFISPFDLIGDESYYWEWSRRPDWCYFSKPPMVAWLIGLSTWVFGDVTAAVRLPAVLLGAVFLLYFVRTARAFYGDRAAALALLLILAAPISVVASFLMTIDASLYCFWMMALFYLRQALFDGLSRAWWWAGLAAAVALLSKQAALLLPVLLAVYLLLDSSRHRLFKREFWWFLLPMLLAAVPIIWWNALHDWVMFGHSKGHFSGQTAVTLSKQLQHTAEFWLYQVLLVSPLSVLLCMIVAGSSAWQIRRLPADQQFLWCLGPLMLLAMVVLSALQKTQGNWSMAFYFSALILVAGQWLAGRWQKLMPYTLTIGTVMVLLTYILPTALSVFHLQNTRWDPTKRFNNWQALVTTLQEKRLAAQPDLQNSFVVALGHRYLASELAFYLPDHPQVFRYEASGQVASQYEVWSGPQDFIGQNGFIVSGDPQLPEALQQAFAEVRLVADFDDPANSRHHYYLYWGQRLQSWPVFNVNGSNQGVQYE